MEMEKRISGIFRFIKNIDRNGVSKWKGRKEKEKEIIFNSTVALWEKCLDLLKILFAKVFLSILYSNIVFV